MRWEAGGEVRYRRKPGLDSGVSGLQGNLELFDPADFPARVIMHVLESRRHLVRYYGWYSNASRGKRRRQAESVEAPQTGGTQADAPRKSPPPDAHALRRRWAELIKRVHEVDPLVCPLCGGEMRIIALIIDHEGPRGTTR